MVVEEVSYKSQVELRITGDQRFGRKELAAWWVKLVRILQNLLGALMKILRIEWATRASIRSELVQKNGVILAVFDV